MSFSISAGKSLSCVAVAAMALAHGAQAAVLSPLFAGQFLSGDGANSSWVQVENNWRGSTYGTETWGTGIWSVADALAVLSLPTSDASVVDTFSGVVQQINYGDQAFIDTWGATWGMPGLALAPLFGDGDAYQDNYAVRFTGFISITDPGAYNFGVLNDDGFRFSLTGSEGTLSIFRDGLNPRDRIGFSEDLTLAAGLYQFDLIGYERLETGVVDLAWFSDGAWEIIPQPHLYTATPVPVPPAAFLFGSGLLALFRTRRKRVS
jgi:hypothetical protein